MERLRAVRLYRLGLIAVFFFLFFGFSGISYTSQAQIQTIGAPCAIENVTEGDVATHQAYICLPTQSGALVWATDTHQPPAGLQPTGPNENAIAFGRSCPGQLGQSKPGADGASYQCVTFKNTSTPYWYNAAYLTGIALPSTSPSARVTPTLTPTPETTTPSATAEPTATPTPTPSVSASGTLRPISTSSLVTGTLVGIVGSIGLVAAAASAPMLQAPSGMNMGNTANTPQSGTPSGQSKTESNQELANLEVDEEEGLGTKPAEDDEELMVGDRLWRRIRKRNLFETLISWPEVTYMSLVNWVNKRFVISAQILEDGRSLRAIFGPFSGAIYSFAIYVGWLAAHSGHTTGSMMGKMPMLMPSALSLGAIASLGILDQLAGVIAGGTFLAYQFIVFPPSRVGHVNNTNLWSYGVFVLFLGFGPWLVVKAIRPTYISHMVGRKRAIFSANSSLTTFTELFISATFIFWITEKVLAFLNEVHGKIKITTPDTSMTSEPTSPLSTNFTSMSIVYAALVALAFRYLLDVIAQKHFPRQYERFTITPTEGSGLGHIVQALARLIIFFLTCYPFFPTKDCHWLVVCVGIYAIARAYFASSLAEHTPSVRKAISPTVMRKMLQVILAALLAGLFILRFRDNTTGLFIFIAVIMVTFEFFNAYFPQRILSEEKIFGFAQIKTKLGARAPMVLLSLSTLAILIYAIKTR